MKLWTSDQRCKGKTLKFLKEARQNYVDQSLQEYVE